MKNYKKLFLFTTCLLVGFLVMTCKSSDSQERELTVTSYRKKGNIVSCLYM